MDIFVTLEERVERIIASYREQQTRLAVLEQENESLKESESGRIAELEQRLAGLEAERAALRERLERLIALLGSVEL
ncbi:MAG: cell division protein ZapB [Thermoanaerobaculaceae bacterium]|nr:cell division protein ZapB [Thermoanaerobaculaceae bacterium]MDI9620870.1 cell division protein ZapB [Acidobacteriota bacterium]NLH10141.1 cell division protein ZapB [Holophagae bacterium]HPW54738.1 cell division protein ZapB [Thermoanaerobaculaceae bacterium]